MGVPAHKAIFNFFNDNKAIFIFKLAIFNLNSSKLTKYAEPIQKFTDLSKYQLA